MKLAVAQADDQPRRDAGTSTLDLALRVIEYLSLQSQPVALAHIAREFEASKATIYRHLVTLQRHGFVRQDPRSGAYGAGIKLMVLGEAQRGRFDILTAAKSALLHMRDRTGLAVTLCTLVDGEVIVLELVQGRSVIDFATRPGTRLDLHASAHGKTWLAFGPRELRERLLPPLKAWTVDTLTDPNALNLEIKKSQIRGWASAPGEVMLGVNALTSPVFDHQGQMKASIGIVGSIQSIAVTPDADMIETVVKCGRDISLELGWQPAKRG